MTVSAQTSVSTTPVKLASAAIGISFPLAYIFQNTGSVTAYLGPSTVTSSTGFPLAAGQTMGIDISSNNDLWAVTASSSTTIAELGES